MVIRKKVTKRKTAKRKTTKRQVGNSNIKLDKKHKALHPGRRKAKVSKKVYYEYRANRSDKDRRKRL